MATLSLQSSYLLRGIYGASSYLLCLTFLQDRRISEKIYFNCHLSFFLLPLFFCVFFLKLSEKYFAETKEKIQDYD